MSETHRSLPKPGQQLPDLPQTFERRAFIRYRRTLETLWELLGLKSEELTSGQVFDLSATGVGLLINQSFPVGRTLMIRLPTATRGWMSHLVRVKRCQQTAEGQFEVGCMFVKPLSATQLQSHLG